MPISARQLLVKCSVDYRSDYLVLTGVVIIIFKAWRHSFFWGGGNFFLPLLIPDPCTALKKNRFFFLFLFFIERFGELLILWRKYILDFSTSLMRVLLLCLQNFKRW